MEDKEISTEKELGTVLSCTLQASYYTPLWRAKESVNESIAWKLHKQMRGI